MLVGTRGKQGRAPYRSTPQNARDCTEDEWEKVQSDKDKHKGAAYACSAEDCPPSWPTHAEESEPNEKNAKRWNIPQTPSGSFDKCAKPSNHLTRKDTWWGQSTPTTAYTWEATAESSDKLRKRLVDNSDSGGSSTSEH